MAKRFRFRFETMLKIRRQREDQHKRIVAERIRQIRQVERERVSLERRIAENMEAIRQSQAGGTIDLQQAIRHRNFLTHLHRAALEAESQRRGLEARLAQERQALAEAAKQCRVLDKLKEHQWDRHRREQERIEQNAADDLNTVRFVYDGVDAADRASAEVMERC